MRGLLLAVALCFVLLPNSGYARGGGHGGSHGGHSGGHGHHSGGGSHRQQTHSKSSSRQGKTKANPGVKRDKHGKIARSPKAKSDFKKTHACPSTGKTSGACPGYVIDHIQALKHGGADDPSNMQWQTTKDAKAKDQWE
jgi:hypothetical protein